MQKLNCILKILFNNDELTPGLKKSRNSMGSKQNGTLEIAVIYSLSDITSSYKK